MARRPATVVNHAPGLDGIPLVDQVPRPGVGILDAFFGQVDVAGDAHRCREHKGPLATVCVSDRGFD